MELTMMSAAEGNCEFVADFAAKRPLLGEAQMMGIGWRSAAHQTTVLHDQLEMLPITDASGFGQAKHTFVDTVWIRREVRRY
jgi:hypothetical protein